MSKDIDSYVPVFFDIETTGTNPLAEGWHDGVDMEAQVTCVGINWSREFPESLDDMKKKTVWNSNEDLLLENLSRVLDTIGQELWARDSKPFFVSYNGNKFDHPYLAARYAKKEMDAHPFVDGWKRLDIFQALIQATGEYWSEDDWAENIGIEVDDEYTGADMPQKFKERNWNAIFEHVKSDIDILAEIFLDHPSMYMDYFYEKYEMNRDHVEVDGEVFDNDDR